MSEFWLIGGCWGGKMMMWTAPKDTNNFNVIGRCRIGHNKDILCVDSSSQFIVSGGVDGLLSIWNLFSGTLNLYVIYLLNYLFSGTLKYAVELPPPKLIGSDIKDFNQDLSDSSCSSKIDSTSSEELSDSEEGNTLSHKSNIFI